MKDAVPRGHHPAQDVLADLAAEALPLNQAREVEAHVMACPECERLLADAERMRAMLNGPDPGPMPDDVWARLAAGFSADSAHQTRAAPAGGWFDDPPPSATPSATPYATPYAQTVPVPSPPPSMSFDEAPTAAWKAFLAEPAEPAELAEPAPAGVPPARQRTGRAVRSVRSRRDVRAESEGSSSWWARPGVLLAAAAAGVAVLGLGGWATISLVGEDHTNAATDVLPGMSARAVVHASGAEYTASTLAEQTKALVRTGSPTPAGDGPAAGRSPDGGSTVPSTSGTVSDPAQLSSCLRALGERGREPVAVDLARYQSREAAVIVLAGKAGGLDVWVVARSCRPGAEGTLAYKEVPAEPAPTR